MATKEDILKQAIQSAGGRCEFERKRELYRNNLAHFEDNFATWLDKHDDEWVAIFNSRLIAHAKTYGELEKILNDKHGISTNEAVIKHLTKRKTTTLF